MHALATMQEYSHADDNPIDERLENWGRCYVDRMRRSRMLSVEGRYRNHWALSWDHDSVVGTAPDVRPMLDVQDAEIINGAWQSVPDAYHQAILGGNYVRRWAPNKCHQIARKVAGLDERDRVSDKEFGVILAMAHELLCGQLLIPAVLRRARLVSRIRDALELDEWNRALQFPGN